MLTASPTLLDRAISYVAPQWGARRVQARLFLAWAGDRARRYEGGSPSSRFAHWRTPQTSANTATQGLDRLRNRCRDLTRNNPWAAKAVRQHASLVVGQGIRPQPSSSSEREARRILDAWKEWAEDSTQCDADGLLNFYGLQYLSWREVAEAGECLVRRRRRRSTDGLRVPLQLQLIEAEQIDTTKDTRTGTRAGVRNRIVHGVEYDALGRRVAYHLFAEHPSDPHVLARESVRVPARDILHVFEVQRAGQARGIPFGASAVVTTRDLDELQDAELVRAKIASCFAGFVRDIEGTSDVPTVMPGSDETKAKEPDDSLSPGTLEFLPEGKTIEFATPPAAQGFDALSQVSLRAIAAAWGLSYESLTGDLRSTSFSSGRMGWLGEHANVRIWRSHTLIPRFCAPAFRWFLEAGDLAGLFNAERAGATTWTAPRREMLQPGPEIRAMVEQIDAGLLSLSEAIRQLGFDPRRMLEELADDLELLEGLGLELALKARKRAAAPDTPPPAPPGDPEAEGGEDGGEDDPAAPAPGAPGEQPAQEPVAARAATNGSVLTGRA